MHDLDRAMLEIDPSVGETESGEYGEFLEILGGLLHGGRGRARLSDQQEYEAVGPYEMPPAQAWGSTARPSSGQAGLGPTATRALADGERNENTLTDMAFADRHPELEGGGTRADERDLARLWLQVRDMIVRPALRALTPFPIRPSSPAATADMDWMPGVVQVRSTHDGGSMLGGPARITWHTYEADPHRLTADSAARALITAGNEVHFVLNPIDGGIVQILPASRAARGLRNPVGGVETNRMGTVHLQVEVIAFAQRPFTDSISAAGLRSVRALIAYARSLGIPDDWPAGDPVAYDPSFPPGHYPPRSNTIWTTRGGHYGHSQVPENTHHDPGAIDTSMLYPVELGQEVFGTGGTAGEFDDRAAREVELASGLLEVQTVAELEQFIGTLLRRAAGAATTLARSDTGRALGGILMQAARQALPMIGSTVDTGLAAQQQDLREGTSLGLELEGLSREDREFEVARAFVRFAEAASRIAAQVRQAVPPADAANAAATAAARRHLPGLLAMLPAAGGSRARKHSGRWVRQDHHIVIDDA